MSLARLSVNRPITVIMRIASLVLLGAICLTRLPVDLLPRITLPTVMCMIQWPNVAAEEIEAQITRRVEQSISAVPNLYEVQSTTSEGMSMVRVQFQWGTDVGRGAVDVLQQVERARRDFPSDPTLQSPVVFRLDPSQLPILILAASGEKDPVKLRTLMDNQVTPILESADGVAAAILTGGQIRAVMVDVDPDRMRARNVGLSEVIDRIEQENQNLPAGLAHEGNTEYTLRSLGWFQTPADLARVPLKGDVLLQDVATVRDSHPETRVYTNLNGEPAVGVIIVKQSDANTVETAEKVFERIQRVEHLFPQLEFRVAYDQSQFIRNSLDQLFHHAILGGILAILILLFFLRNLASTLVVALSIPISIVSTFSLLYLCGFTINTMSLAGLALATGLIVDDAVVVLENIFRHFERDGTTRVEAAVTGTNEIMTAVVSSTLTIMIVFLPLLMIRGQAGQMFFQFALVVVFSLAVSLLDAATVVPMLASRMTGHQGSGSGWLQRQFDRWGRWQDQMERSYRAALQWSLHHRLRVLAGAAAITLGSFLLWPLIGTEMMPATDSGDFTVRVELPVGTSLATTHMTMERVQAILAANPDVATAFTAIGTSLSIRGTTTSERSFLGSATVKLKDDRKHTTAETIRSLRKELSSLAGVRVSIQPYDLVSTMISGRNQGLEINLFGSELSVLAALSTRVMSELEAVDGLVNVSLTTQAASPEVQWTVDRSKLRQLGMTFEDVADMLRTATSGTLAGYFQEGGFQYPITVQFPEQERRTVDQLSGLPLRTPTGQYITLGQVARSRYAEGPGEITRLNRQRFVSLTAEPEGRSLSDVQAEAQRVLDGIEFPEGYYWDWGSNQRRRAEEFAGMGVAVWLAIGLIYMLLASQFESLIHPLTVLTSVPLAASGVLLALFLSGRAFGLTAFVGLLMLVGIVVKNGILLVDYTNLLRSRGMGKDEALLLAGPTRLRPILMTAGAGVLGMLPIAIGLGAGSEIQAPLATAVVGGLTASTFLTLLVVPTVYSLLDGVETQLKALVSR
ncbi:efflux RND transporter permease subunit [bacterium CPR1]|nr:efflux RND transporter permease subunit [bacterium CPR1]